MKKEFRKHWRVFRVRMTEVFQYRLRAFVWFLVGIVNITILLLFWLATLKASPETASTTLPAITSYYILMFTFGTMISCHIEEDIAYRDIYKGNIYGQLLKPYSYLAGKFHEEIVWRMVGFFYGLVSVIVLLALGLQLHFSHDPSIWFITFVSVLLGTGICFFYKCCLGLMAVWFTNIKGLMEVSDIIQLLLSGFILPVALLPPVWKEIASWSHFSSMVYSPVIIFTEGPSVEGLVLIFAKQIFWFLFFAIAAQFIFHKAMRSYTGVGQ